MWKLKTHRIRRTPNVLQMEAVECGAAALAMILEYHGTYRNLAELRRDCGVSRDGSKAPNVLKAARHHGLEATGFKKDLDSVQKVEPPFIVFWNFNHFLVCEGFKGGKVYINDPALGHRIMPMEEFDDGFTGVVLTFKPGKDFRRSGRRPSMLPQILRRLKGSWTAVIYCFLVGSFMVIPNLAIPAYTQVFLDQVLGEQRRDWLRPLILAMGSTVILVGVLNSLQMLCLRRFRIALSLRLASQFFWHLLRMPVGFYAQRFAGEIANRFKLNNKVASVLSGQLATTMIDITMMSFYAVVMWFYAPALTGIGVFFAVLNFLALRALGKKRVEANIRLQSAVGKSMGYSIGGLQSMETLPASGVESSFFSTWSGFYSSGSVIRQEL